MKRKTSAINDRGIALFVFAHQDDEFGVFSHIKTCVRDSLVICVYFTDGGSSKRRNSESLAVLHRLGVVAENVYFAGHEMGISDGHLHDSLSDISLWMDRFISTHQRLTSVHVPAWEGGHPDHDALHSVIVSVLHAHGMMANIKQFSLYNSKNCIGPFFRVLTPITENGPKECVRIPLLDRIRFLYYCLCYLSQAKTWLGLFPFVLAHLVLNGCQELQVVNIERIFERPHSGMLYYEKRGFLSWKCLLEAVIEFQDSFSPDGKELRKSTTDKELNSDQ